MGASGSKAKAAMVAIAVVVSAIGLFLLLAPSIFGLAVGWLATSICILGGGLLTGGLWAGYEALYNPVGGLNNNSIINGL